MFAVHGCNTTPRSFQAQTESKAFQDEFTNPSKQTLSLIAKAQETQCDDLVSAVMRYDYYDFVKRLCTAGTILAG